MEGGEDRPPSMPAAEAMPMEAKRPYDIAVGCGGRNKVKLKEQGCDSRLGVALSGFWPQSDLRVRSASD